MLRRVCLYITMGANMSFHDLFKWIFGCYSSILPLIWRFYYLAAFYLNWSEVNTQKKTHTHTDTSNSTKKSENSNNFHILLQNKVNCFYIFCISGNFIYCIFGAPNPQNEGKKQTKIALKPLFSLSHLNWIGGRKHVEDNEKKKTVLSNWFLINLI